MCVILDTYNNITQIHMVKTRITHNGGSKVLNRRKQTNKKIKKGQKDVWHGSSMKCEARHATQFPPSSTRSPWRRAKEDIVVDLGLVFQASTKVKSGSAESVFVFVLFYLPFLSSIHEKANCIAILWTGSPHSLGSCLFRGLWATCLPHKGKLKIKKSTYQYSI